MDGEKIIKSLKCLLFSHKTGMFIQDLVKKYRELGYNSFLDLITEISLLNLAWYDDVMDVQSAPKSGPFDVDVTIQMETEPIMEQMEIPVRNLPAKKQVTVIITSASSSSDFHVIQSFVSSFRYHFEEN